MNSFDLILRGARSSGGFEEVTSPADLDVWRGIVAHYSTVLRDVPKRNRMRISLDWSRPILRAERRANFYSKPFNERISLIQKNETPFDLEMSATASVEFLESQKNGLLHAGIDVVKHLLYEIYLVANLATPGSFNMYKSHIRAQGIEPGTDPLAEEDLELSEFLFETSWHYAQDNLWTKIEFIPFNRVHAWHEQLGIGYRQVARTSVEKALFCMLHLGKSSSLEPEATFWLAAALEAIYKTPHGSSFQHLHGRIAQVLNLSNDEHAVLRKRLREFYDIRNAFSHGGGSICYPIPDESYDPEVDEIIIRTMDANQFAFSILLASMQELIRSDSSGFEFQESVKRVPVGPPANHLLQARRP